MNIHNMIVDQVKKLGGDGIVNLEIECGCGERFGWLLCDGGSLHECEPARWKYCKDCERNGKCDYQSEYEITDGCYAAIREGGQMSIHKIIVDRVKELGGDGIVNHDIECGCGKRIGWLHCDGNNLRECEPAKWQDCKDCEHNGKCDYQSEHDVTDGCYRAIKKGGSDVQGN